MEDSRERIVILIDGPNFYNIARIMAIRVDYLKLINILTTERRVVAKTIFCKLPHSNSIRFFTVN